MAESTPTPESKPEQPAAPVAEPKALSADESAKVLAALQKANAEAKQYREKLEAETKAKADAEQAKLAAEGKWQELAAAKQREADELRSKAERASVLEQKLAAFRDAQIADLPEAVRTRLAKLDPDDAMAVAAEWKAANAAPKAAPAVNGGAPAPSKAPIDMTRLTPEQARDYLRQNPNERKSLLSKLAPHMDPFAGR